MHIDEVGCTNTYTLYLFLQRVSRLRSARTLPSFHCMFLYQLCSLILVFLSLFHSHLEPFTFSTIIHTNTYFYSWVCLRLSVVPPMKMSTLRMVSHGVVLHTTPVNKRCMHIYQTLLLLELHTAIRRHLIKFTFLSLLLEVPFLKTCGHCPCSDYFKSVILLNATSTKYLIH